jgi:hypothetical protein
MSCTEAAWAAQGAVRRILFAPPAAEGLARGALGAAAGAAAASARVSVLFANGTFGVWELDANMELWQARPCL